MSAVHTWRVGDVQITRVAEGPDFPIDPGMLFPIDRRAVLEHAWLLPHFATPDGDLLMTIQAFVIEIGQRRIVVDTCIGNDKQRHAPMWNKLQGPFLRDLAAAGYPPETIDTVICTHLHIDHVGWNTRWVDGRWIPTFPNARYLFARIEWEYWRDEVERQRIAGDDLGSEAARMMQTDLLIEDSIRPVMEAGLHALIEVDHRLADGVTLEPTPGHTPGHVSVWIDSRGQQALITGDMIHHPLQCARPGVGTHVDWDRERGQQTRLSFLQRLADQRVLVLGSHFATPTAGYVRADGDRWRFAIEPAAAAAH